MIRMIVSDVLVVFGGGLVAYAAMRVDLSLGLLVIGCFCVAVGIGSSLIRRKPKQKSKIK